MVKRFTDVYRDWLDTSEVPQIIVKGRYLEKFGFSLGMPVMVSVENGKITITPISDDVEEEFI
jgi:hypothetical protein